MTRIITGTATAKGPKINLRFRNLREKQEVERAARRMNVSVNTYIITHVLMMSRRRGGRGGVGAGR